MASTQPELASQVMASANTEYKVKIPAGTRLMRVRNRNAVDLRYAYETGKVAAPIEPFGTIKSGSTYETNLRGQVVGNAVSSTETTQVIYLASASADQVAELEFWL